VLKDPLNVVTCCTYVHIIKQLPLISLAKSPFLTGLGRTCLWWKTLLMKMKQNKNCCPCYVYMGNEGSALKEMVDDFACFPALKSKSEPAAKKTPFSFWLLDDYKTQTLLCCKLALVWGKTAMTKCRNNPQKVGMYIVNFDLTSFQVKLKRLTFTIYLINDKSYILLILRIWNWKSADLGTIIKISQSDSRWFTIFYRNCAHLCSSFSSRMRYDILNTISIMTEFTSFCATLSLCILTLRTFCLTWKMNTKNILKMGKRWERNEKERAVKSMKVNAVFEEHFVIYIEYPIL